MEGTSHIEREYGALGGLFQQIIQDMKVGDIAISCKVWASYAIVLLSNGKVAVDILYNVVWFWLGCRGWVCFTGSHSDKEVD